MEYGTNVNVATNTGSLTVKTKATGNYMAKKEQTSAAFTLTHWLQMQTAGILMGKSSNRFHPTATSTRAEVSAMLRRFVELVVNTETPEGWAMNESGQWMYIENGKRTTSKKLLVAQSISLTSTA